LVVEMVRTDQGWVKPLLLEIGFRAARDLF
jgi:hypothetical protein